jgi:hypothetical protein
MAVAAALYVRRLRRAVVMIDAGKIKRAIDEAISPKNVNPYEALEFLEDLASDIEMRKDSLRADIQSKG